MPRLFLVLFLFASLPASAQDSLYAGAGRDIDDRLLAARAWAFAGNSDSALYHLARVASGGWTNVALLEEAVEFRAVRTDARWAQIVDVVRKNAAQAGQKSLAIIRRIPTEARLLTVDETGNAYTVRTDNNLVRYTATGDSSAFFRSVLNGPIGAVDPANPLRILVYYPGFSTVVPLDRMLAPMSEIKLTRLGISAPTVVAASADGGLWVYDPVTARLKKFSEEGRLLQEGTDLRLELGVAPKPSFLLERDRRLALCDTAHGIFLFDRFAAPTLSLPVPGVDRVQLSGTQVVYRSGSLLKVYDAQSGREQSLPIPAGDGPMLEAQVVRGVLYVLYKRALVLYRMPE